MAESNDREQIVIVDCASILRVVLLDVEYSFVQEDRCYIYIFNV